MMTELPVAKSGRPRISWSRCFHLATIFGNLKLLFGENIANFEFQHCCCFYGNCELQHWFCKTAIFLTLNVKVIGKNCLKLLSQHPSLLLAHVSPQEVNQAIEALLSATRALKHSSCPDFVDFAHVHMYQHECEEGTLPSEWICTFFRRKTGPVFLHMYIHSMRAVDMYVLIAKCRVTRWVYENITQKCSPTHFLSNLNINISLNVVTSKPNVWASAVIFINPPKENNHPMGENSPNLVTLAKCRDKEIHRCDKRTVLPNVHANLSTYEPKGLFTR
jgi:hypothetical protein